MVRERRISPRSADPEEEHAISRLRPSRLADYVGQTDLVSRLRIAIEAAKERGEAVGHILFHGPPGLGKTTLSHIIAEEMSTRLIRTSGPALTRPADLMGILTGLEEGDVLFIDETHRLPRQVEEFLYPAMEDFRVDFVLDQGPMARTINFALKRFTIIGATTRPGLLSGALRDRFYLFYHVGFYSEEELRLIIESSAGRLGIHIDTPAAIEISRRSRGTPRTANRLLMWVRDFSQARRDGSISIEITREALAMEGVDEKGLDAFDRRYLKAIIEHYGGGPVGVEAIGATLNEETDSLVDVVEPYLLRAGFLQRTRGGRCAAPPSYVHLGLAPPKGAQENLWTGIGEDREE